MLALAALKTKRALLIGGAALLCLLCLRVLWPATSGDPKGVAAADGASSELDARKSEATILDSSASDGALQGREAGDADRVDRRSSRLIESGAQPRAPLRYLFTADQPSVRVGGIRMSASVETTGKPPQQQDQPFVQLTLKLTPGALTNRGYPVLVRLEKAALLEAPGLKGSALTAAQARIATLAGLGGKFDITPRGQLGHFEPAGESATIAREAAEVLQLLQQLLELSVVPLPEEPVGAGARWEELSIATERGLRITTTTVFTLKELHGDQAVVLADMKRSAPRVPYDEPRVQPDSGMGIEFEATGSFTFEVKLDRPTVKVSGENTTIARIESVDQASRPARRITQTMKTRPSLDTPTP